MKIKVPVGKLIIEREERKEINEILDSGLISEGKYVREFEKKWAGYIGTKYCVATSSGTAALITALLSLRYLFKLENRLKVVTSPLTYIADANAIVLSGFYPVFVDVDPEKFSIIPEEIEELLKNDRSPEKYSVILPVDLIGYSVELEKIKIIAKKYGLYVLEDAAQAHGTVHHGKKCGSNVDAGVFSFYIAHNIQAGELGAITTSNQEIYRMSKKIKTNGRYCSCEICTRLKGTCPQIKSQSATDNFDPRFYHEVIGYNFKTMEFQAILAIAQMRRIKQIIKKRKDNLRYLNQGLAKFSDILKLPCYDKNASYLCYPIVIKNTRIISRKELCSKLEKRGIETRPVFSCIPTQQPAYSHLKETYKNRLPNAEFIGLNGFYIGCHQYLSRNDLDYVIANFTDILRKL